MVHHLKSGFLSHGLDLADDLIHIAFLDQLLRQVGIQHHRHVGVCLGHVALLLGHFNKKVVLCQAHLHAVHLKGERSLCIQLIHGRIAVQRGQVFLDTAQLLAVFRANRAQLRLEGIGGKVSHVVREHHLLHIQFVLDDLPVEIAQGVIRLHEHGSDGLAVLDVGRISAGASHHDDVQNLFHILFQLLIHKYRVRCRIIAQVHALRRVFIQPSDQIQIDFLRHEGDHGRGKLCQGDQRGIQGHVGVDLVLLHALCPETLAASSHVPVAALVHEILQGSRRLGNLVVVQSGIHLGDQGVQAA